MGRLIYGHAHYDTVGDCKLYAQACANRDDCKWVIWRDDCYDDYAVVDEFTKQDYFWKKKIAEISPQTKSSMTSNQEAVLLTPDEKALVAAVLDPDEIGREYYPGDDATKTSLWRKLLGMDKQEAKQLAAAKKKLQQKA